ncbi:N-acetylgalactosamine-6-sulfatase [Echinicola strongylocentroti]|uniref:N-acetylgalactosamine-6-sulfatase n=1 Tax=Echinicola strongylocentroti TaxID=1795355 RepID=A0A2Z4INC8_9BACT|nr:arylsulfatase [Echinicola strongylocentroti]AWW32395.1 N-acetylgalactosamine-6-sulfatase [Echinicola strongylocentroti]
MRIQIFVGCFVASLFMMGCQSTANKTTKEQSKPNIIYIYADDMGFGEVGVNGQEKIKTPNLDKMAAEGMVFTQHYTSSPVCAPARCGLMTGLHTGHAYIRGNKPVLPASFTDEVENGQQPLPEGTVTIGKMLQDAGYVTGAIGKWGLGMTGNSGAPNRQGFDYFYGYLDQRQAHNFYPTHLWENDQWDSLANPYIFVHAPSDRGNKANAQAMTNFAKSGLKYGDEGFFDAYKGEEYAVDKMTEKATQFIQGHKDQPFFLYLPYTIPHVSLQVPDAALDPYLGKFEEEPYLGQQGYAPHEFPKSAYAAMISYLDQEVGKILHLLKAEGLDENTLVIFTSDNGPTFNGGVDAPYFNSTAGLRGLKMDVYEGGVRMPMIARWPGKVPANSKTDHVSAQYDVMATLADLVGTEAPKMTDGVSFLPALSGDIVNQEPHEFLYFEYPEKGGQLAIRMGKWKGVKTGLKKEPDAAWELYDLENDVNETNDIAAANPAIVKKLDAIAKKEHKEPAFDQWGFMETVLGK